MKNKTTTRAPCIHKVQAMIYVYVVRRFCLYIFFMWVQRLLGVRAVVCTYYFCTTNTTKSLQVNCRLIIDSDFYFFIFFYRFSTV